MNKNYIPKEAAAIDLLNNIKQWVDSPAGREILKRGLIASGTGLGTYAATSLVDPKGKHKGKRAIGSILAGLLAGWKGEDAAKYLASSYKNWAAKRQLAVDNARRSQAAVTQMRNSIVPTGRDIANTVVNQALKDAEAAQERQNEITRKSMSEGEERAMKQYDEDFANRR